MRTSANASGGFTLIELMMAMLVLTVGLLGLLQSIQVAYQHNSRNRLREEAVLLAEEQMNTYRLNPALSPVTTASRMIGGGARDFMVIRESQPVGNSRRLRVAVHWGFRNVTATHEIYSVKKM